MDCSMDSWWYEITPLSTIESYQSAHVLSLLKFLPEALTYKTNCNMIQQL